MELYLKQHINVVTMLSEYSDKTAKVCTFTKFGKNVGLCKTGFGSGKHLTKTIFKIKMNDFSSLISILSKMTDQTSGRHYYVIGYGKNYKGNDTMLVLQSWSENKTVLELASYTAIDAPQTEIDVPDPEDEEGGWVDIDETPLQPEWIKDFGSFYFGSKDNLTEIVKRMRTHYREVQELDDINEPDLEDDDGDDEAQQVQEPSIVLEVPTSSKTTVSKKRGSTSTKPRAPKKQKTDEVRETLAALFEYMRINKLESPKQCVLLYNLELIKYEKHDYLGVIKEYSEDDLLTAFASVKKMLK